MLFVLLLAAAPPWQQAQQADGITVYRRFSDGSSFVSMKGVGVIDASILKVAIVFLDDDRVHEWAPDLDSHVVRIVNEGEYIEYNHVHMPPLITDREFITDVTLAADEASQTATIISEPTIDMSVPEKDRIRGVLHSSYGLQALDATHTRIAIELTTDPKGSLPAWLVNYFQEDWALDVIRGVRKQCAKPDIKTLPAFAAFLSKLH